MTRKQKVLLFACGLLAGYLFTWPFAILLVWFFAEVDGKVPTVPEPHENDE